MKTSTKLTSAVLAAAALFGLSGFTSAASAEPTSVNVHSPAAAVHVQEQPGTDDEMKASATRRFTVSNLSDKSLRYVGSDTVHANDPFPASGTVIKPGGQMSFEITFWFLYDQKVTSAFDVLDGNGNVVGKVQMDMKLDGFASPSSDGWWNGNTSGQVKANGYDIAVLNTAGTVTTIPAGQGQAQAKILEQYCQLGNATCEFTPKKHENVLGPRRVVGNMVYNNMPDAQNTTITVSDTVGSTDSLQIAASVKVSIMKIVEATVSTTYGHTWTNSHTFTQAEQLSIRPYHKAWLEAAEPMNRYTGDFVVRMGNTTWNLQDVYFDSPNPNGAGSYIKQTAPMTDQEKGDNPAGLVQSTISAVQALATS